MIKLLAYAIILMLILGANQVVANYDETGLGVAEQMKEVVVQHDQPSYRERLEQMVSRGEIRSLDMKITAYDLSYDSCEKNPDGPAYGITYSGEPVREGIVAVDPKVIPIHTRLYIDGYGIVEAKDVGGAIKGNRLDIFMWDGKRAQEWGVQIRKVYILGR